MTQSSIWVTKILVKDSASPNRPNYFEFVVFSRYRPNVEYLRELGLMSGEDDWFMRIHVFKELFPNIKLSAFKPVKMKIDLKRILK